MISEIQKLLVPILNFVKQIYNLYSPLSDMMSQPVLLFGQVCLFVSSCLYQSRLVSL